VTWLLDDGSGRLSSYASVCSCLGDAAVQMQDAVVLRRAGPTAPPSLLAIADALIE
jgi:hypothetical protein